MEDDHPFGPCPVDRPDKTDLVALKLDGRWELEVIPASWCPEWEALPALHRRCIRRAPEAPVSAEDRRWARSYDCARRVTELRVIERARSGLPLERRARDAGWWTDFDGRSWLPPEDTSRRLRGEAASGVVQVELRGIAYGTAIVRVSSADASLDFCLDAMDSGLERLVHWTRRVREGAAAQTVASSDCGSTCFYVAYDPAPGQDSGTFTLGCERESQWLHVRVQRSALVHAFTSCFRALAEHPSLGRMWFFFGLKLDDDLFERRDAEAEAALARYLAANPERAGDEDFEGDFTSRYLSEVLPLDTYERARTKELEQMLTTLEVPPDWPL